MRRPKKAKVIHTGTAGISDAAWAQEAERRLVELRANPCGCGEDCSDKLLIALLSSSAGRMEQIKVGLWLDSVSKELAQKQKDEEFARGLMLLITGPRADKKVH